MADGRLLTRWRVELELLTPLHVGAGGPRLLAGYDFAVDGGEVWVLDIDRVLAHLPEAALARALTGEPVAELPRTAYAACARYRLRLRGGGAALREILPCARDVHERPYLPGSTLKGALRTALAWQQASAAGRPLATQNLDKRSQFAARPLERQLFGPDPHHDLLRALRVADLTVVGEPAVELTVAAVYSLRGGRLEPKGQGFRWYLEALPAGTRLAGTLALDEHLCRVRQPDFGSQRAWLAQVARHCTAFARALAQAEARFYAEARLPALAAFYDQLAKQAASAASHEGLVQLGWGTGWTAKTLGLLLRAAPDFPALVARYRLDRGRNAGVFPKTRRLVERGNTPEQPLGWARFALHAV
ncbi:MAG TPA: type III-A CRISPR-associated RAMP protein Csm5 [Chloroflexota bacterium]|nr:type III-A CRISPR-associated RAMP protein Csm5 [Chloroflexota bacterium]